MKAKVRMIATAAIVCSMVIAAQVSGEESPKSTKIKVCGCHAYAWNQWIDSGAKDYSRPVIEPVETAAVGSGHAHTFHGTVVEIDTNSLVVVPIKAAQ